MQSIQRWLIGHGRVFTVNELQHLKVLSLGHASIDKIPPEITELANLEILILNNNQLQDIPPEIRQLTKLRELHLQHNQIQDLTKVLKVTRYLNLEYLGLRYN